jgi:hypothetical protein
MALTNQNPKTNERLKCTDFLYDRLRRSIYFLKLSFGFWILFLFSYFCPFAGPTIQ